MTDDRSLLQNTLLRLDSAGAQARPTLVCNEAHRYIAAEQAQELGIKDAELILEPHARNTAPAIAAATLRAMRGGEDPVMLIMPSDHVLEDGEVLAAAYAQAYLAARQGALVTFGITPTAPLSGYGYIQADAPAAMAPARRVRRFVEKPSPEVAQLHRGRQLLLEQRHVRVPGLGLPGRDGPARAAHAAAGAPRSPPGMATMRCSSLTARPSRPAPAIRWTTPSWSAPTAPWSSRWPRPGATWAPGTRSGASPQIGGGQLDHRRRDGGGFAQLLIHSTSRLVASVGLDDIVVIETADAVLVAHKSRSQDVKRLVEAFRSSTVPS